MIKFWFRSMMAGGCLLITAIHCVAQNIAEPRLESNGLKVLDAIAWSLHDVGDKQSVLRLSLIVQNVSDKEFTVVTNDTSVTVMNYGVPLYEMGLNTQDSYKGVALVSSIYQFYPVTLRPQEATIITVDQPLPRIGRRTGSPQPIEGKEGKYVTIGYTITSGVAERHKLWQGVLVSEPVLVRLGRRTPPTPEEIQQFERSRTRQPAGVAK